MKTKLLLFLVLFLSYFETSNATTYAGMNITYQWTGVGNDYIFKLRLYRNCFGAAAWGSEQVEFRSASCALNFMATLTLQSTTVVNSNPCAGLIVSACYGGNDLSFEQLDYVGVVTVPPCADWVVTKSVCCRDFWITNIVNPDIYNGHVETKFDNLNFPGNSSPAFNTLPFNYYCSGLPSLKDYSAIDPDGDSIYYELVPVLQDTNVIVPLSAGYTYDQPLASFTGTYLDSLYGYLHFTPSMNQMSALALLVSEYRNGQLISTVRIDDEIAVEGVITNPDSIAGRVFVDNNSNSTFDAGDVAIPNVNLQLAYPSLNATTSTQGEYYFLTNNGIWNIIIPNPPLYMSFTPSSISVNTNSITFSGNNNFICSFTSNINDLEIFMNNAGSPVPGQIYQLFVTYKNTGTTTQTNVDITVTLDADLQYVSANQSPSNVTGNTITFTIPSINPFATGDIHIMTSVDIAAIPNSSVQCSGSITPVINDASPANNSDYINDHVAAPFDPNAKEVSPSGDIGLPFVVAQNWITYRVHFQNLGNAPAQEVRISDFLDLDLEIGSLELVASSFPCSMSLSGFNHVEFTFSGINLPAASVDEPGSHGFVEYRIKPKSTLVLGTFINNNAAIYFDFNAPVYTNMVQNKVVTSVGLQEHTSRVEHITVYPNPSTDNFTLELFTDKSREVEIHIYNQLGSEVKYLRADISNNWNQIPLTTSGLQSGNYFIVVTGKNYREVVKFSVVR